MNEQPEALRLADELAIQHQYDFYKVCEEAAAELRRLHEENERLRAAVLAEREACAKLCDVQIESGALSELEKYRAGFIADAIRARGEMK